MKNRPIPDTRLKTGGMAGRYAGIGEVPTISDVNQFSDRHAKGGQGRHRISMYVRGLPLSALYTLAGKHFYPRMHMRIQGGRWHKCF